MALAHLAAGFGNETHARWGPNCVGMKKGGAALPAGGAGGGSSRSHPRAWWGDGYGSDGIGSNISNDTDNSNPGSNHNNFF